MTRRSALDPAKGWIDEMLRADLTAPPKQRHTNKRILARLRDEYGFTADAYTTLNDYLRVRRPQIKDEADRARMLHEGMVPQSRRPGEEAEAGRRRAGRRSIPRTGPVPGLAGCSPGSSGRRRRTRLAA
ncbi:MULTISPECIES: hypothetical protein [unclassified Kitasatospora]|uniref:hypothetical protein n=1 Tax=unclassified Kitasatospora TaxID=2633591 RepID=UPI0033CFCF70